MHIHLMKLKLIQIIFFLLFSLTSTFAQGIKINEVSSSNANVIKDNDGDSPDWIELYNNSSAAINLSNFYISDDVNNLTMWQFPQRDLEPDSFLVLFASGKADLRDDSLAKLDKVASVLKTTVVDLNTGIFCVII